MKKYFKSLLLACSLVASCASPAYASCYSEGVRVGTIQKFSAKGMINKSWEGELVMEGLKLKPGVDGGTKGGNVWQFSVLDPAVAKAIDDATMSGGSIALRYCQSNPLIFVPTTTSTSYIITQAVARK